MGFFLSTEYFDLFVDMQTAIMAIITTIKRTTTTATMIPAIQPVPHPSEGAGEGNAAVVSGLYIYNMCLKVMHYH